MAVGQGCSPIAECGSTLDGDSLFSFQLHAIHLCAYAIPASNLLEEIVNVTISAHTVRLAPHFMNGIHPDQYKIAHVRSEWSFRNQYGLIFQYSLWVESLLRSSAVSSGFVRTVEVLACREPSLEPAPGNIWRENRGAARKQNPSLSHLR